MRRALSFLTPFGGSTTPSPSALAWFPLVGALVGLGVGGAWWLGSKVWAAPAAAAVALAADLVLTGYLHLDGLADAADGLLPPLDRDRRLAAMADPAVGAFGVVTVGVVLLLRFGAFASIHPDVLAVGALWCGSRTAMALFARSLPYARQGGLASAFLAPGSQERGRDVVVEAVLGLALASAMALAGARAHGLVALVGEMLAVTAVVLLALRRLGGFTGDVLGAAGVLGETVGLLLLAAKW